MNDEMCDLAKQIPHDLLYRAFDIGDVDLTFLCFEKVYQAVTNFVPKNRTIIDFGCAYAFQSWYFRDYDKYIGVEVYGNENIVLKLPNSEFYFMSIQKFITEEFDKLGINKDEVFAICSYVPDKEAREMVRKEFPHCLVYYP